MTDKIVGAFIALWALASMVGMFLEIMRRSKSLVRRVFRALTVPLIIAGLPFLFLGFVAEVITDSLSTAEDKLVAFMKELADD